ncbi:hypothetical protein sscle_01g008660 [Sclerotinia sclerotiorum 1980 UF-70]|uniref:Uncharacterized protein n=1 Tax=Sclerotinia sclerotiorum (strain ATCC 18683 / 1980 / Ss-1) TaxID=665079 RepID=A0A1D9PTV6_SCLS1|nr:hypothetical protein sscle_01g008660 [Sclerotinia sclerotiorum 1980 UF-70]
MESFKFPSGGEVSRHRIEIAEFTGFQDAHCSATSHEIVVFFCHLRRGYPKNKRDMLLAHFRRIGLTPSRTPFFLWNDKSTNGDRAVTALTHAGFVACLSLIISP